MKKILILSANPKDTGRLRLDEEYREIDEGLRRSKNRDNFSIHSKWAVRIRDLRRALLDSEPNIVHFCGHGQQTGIMVENESGDSVLVDPAALSELFALFKEHVECVLLNACYSELQARSITKHIRYAIGMRKGIQDRAAIEFAVGFYDALGVGKPIEEAFRFGRNAIQLYSIPKNLTPVLLKRGEATESKPQRGATGSEAVAGPEGPEVDRDTSEAFQVAQQLVENSPDAIVVIDGEGKIAFATSKAEATFGVSVTELVGKPFDSLVDSPKPLLLPGKLDAAALRGPWYFKLSCKSKEGTHRYVEAHGAPLSRAGGMQLLLTDVTERRQAEEALRESEEKYRSIVESVPEAIVLLDLKGVILMANQVASRILGYELGELIDNSFSQFLSPSSAYTLDGLLRAIESAGKAQDPLELVCKDGRIILAEVEGKRVESFHQVGAYQLSVRDVTEREFDFTDLQCVVRRFIEFPPEFHQAGVSILNYFASVLRHKYADVRAKVRIEQEGLKVKMLVATDRGDREVIERALNDYGLVVTGKAPPEQLLSDPLHVLELKHQLELARMQLRFKQDVLECERGHIRHLEKQVKELVSLVGKALQSGGI